MILADTSIWVDHLRENNEKLADLLLRERIVCHPLVVAEVSLGSLRQRDLVLGSLDSLPSLPAASLAEIRALIEARKLFSRGIGFVDASLLASCLLAPGATLWTRDRRLATVASDLGISDSRSSHLEAGKGSTPSSREGIHEIDKDYQ